MHPGSKATSGNKLLQHRLFSQSSCSSNLPSYWWSMWQKGLC